MLRLITLPFRWVRATRYALIASGALISGLGLWMQIKGVPTAGEPMVNGLQSLMVNLMDGPTTVFGVFSKIGGVMALCGLLGMTVHDISPAGQTTPRAKVEPVGDGPPKTTSPALSTWQERLAAKTEPRPVVQPLKAGVSTLHMGLIGVVICAFLAVLGATLLGNTESVTSEQSQTLAQSSGPGHAMIRAHLAASGAVNDKAADISLTALSMPRFDPAIVVPWVKSQLAKALTGDQAAMITLGSVLGGIFVLMLGIKIMFAVRRDKITLQTPTRRASYS